MTSRGNVVDFESERRAIESAQRVRCAHCGRWIPMRATRCELCGIYFDGYAFEFHRDKDEQPRITRAARRAAFVIMALIILGSMAFYLVLPLMRR